ncbi:MAG: DUF192 domain-containing protein [Candidatus Woesearchaeota archaeon]|jgi:uncharacterized membrane protein (UPF0127 family)|nr:DUF192 domain-containing protein [Candidatus Woesearchaeota archaeon]
MAKLTHKKKVILPEMKYATSIFDIGKGLMFANKKKIEKGMCLVMPTRKNQKYVSAVTMFFCFHPMDIIFINKEFEVVDNITLNPWKSSYVPKKPCKYVIESTKDKFKNITIGEKVKLEI